LPVGLIYLHTYNELSEVLNTRVPYFAATVVSPTYIIAGTLRVIADESILTMLVPILLFKFKAGDPVYEYERLKLELSEACANVSLRLFTVLCTKLKAFRLVVVLDMTDSFVRGVAVPTPNPIESARNNTLPCLSVIVSSGEPV
jgi:hypothetical protein